MGWREALERQLWAECGGKRVEVFSSLVAMPAPDRVALARELLSGMGKCVEDWQPIETAPKDGTEILLKGFWDNEGYPGTGSPFYAVAGWATLSSRTVNAQYDWYSGLHALSNSLVKLTHWRPVDACRAAMMGGDE